MLGIASLRKSTNEVGTICIKIGSRQSCKRRCSARSVRARCRLLGEHSFTPRQAQTHTRPARFTPFKFYTGGVDAEDVRRELTAATKAPCVIYTYGLSPFSTEALAVLEATGATFETRELGLEWFLLGPRASVMRAELETLTGQSSLPHVFIGGVSVGGLSTGTPGLATLDETGELISTLKKAKALR